MKRFFYATAAALALLVPALTSAQVNTVYVPGAHPRVVVVPPEATPTERVAPALTPSEVIAMHTRMAAGHRANLRVDHSAVAHCERLIAAARAEIRRSN